MEMGWNGFYVRWADFAWQVLGSDRQEISTHTMKGAAVQAARALAKTKRPSMLLVYTKHGELDVAVSYPAPRVAANQRQLAGAAAASSSPQRAYAQTERPISLSEKLDGGPEDWAGQLHRDIQSLRDRWSAGTLPEEPLAILDSSYEELRASTEDVLDHSSRLEAVTVDAVKSRRRYALLLKLIGVVLETDEAGVIRDASPAAARLLEVRGDFLVQKPLAGFVAGSDYHAFQELLREVRHGSIRGRELLLQPRDGPAVRMIASAVRAEAHDDDPATILWHLREPVDRSGDWKSRP